MSVNGQTVLSTTLPDRVDVELSIPMGSNMKLRLEPESPSARHWLKLMQLQVGALRDAAVQ